MWSYKRTAGTQLGWAGLPAVLFLFGLLALVLPGIAAAEDGNEDSAKLRTALDFGGALEIEFFAEKGKSYTVEAQASGAGWTGIYGPVYGEGVVVKDIVRSPEPFVSFRLAVDDLADYGNAPVELLGHSYSLNDGNRVVGYHFADVDGGVAIGEDGVQRGFSYSYLKTHPDIAELVLEFPDGVSEEVSLRFYHGRIGIFDSTVLRAGRRRLKSSGTFRSGGDSNPDNALPPLTMEGSKFIFRDRGMSSVMTFATDFSGSLSRQGGDSEVISYTYDISSWPEASLEIAFTDSDDIHHYVMDFSARNSGRFTRRTVEGDKTKDTDRGKFSGKGVEDEDDDGKGGGNTETECLAPESLQGRTLQATIAGKVVTILLDGAGTGSILKRLGNRGVALLPFSYTYSKENSTEGLLTITLSSGGGVPEVQVFKLDFITRKGGDCIRKRYEDDALDDTHSGTFSLSDDDGAGDEVYRGDADE